MAGGPHAAVVACLGCIFEGRAEPAYRTSEGIETDWYRCERGHTPGIDWRRGAPTAPCWPLSDSEREAISRLGRAATPFALAHASRRDGPEVEALLGATFGPREDQLTLFDTWLVDPARVVQIARSADSARTLLGVGVASILNERGLAGYSRIRPDLPTWLADRRAGSLQTLAVHPTARRTGVGRALAAAMVQWLRSREVEVLLGVSWQHGGADNSARLYEAAGFERLGTSATFFAEEQARSGQPCAVCGTPCRCEAWLFGALRTVVRT
ncbi:MAG: GNAT family N-acetyltransferase [Deltaproteobacteria bacterium]|nr:GNAT family N-acetyltransferase [Deltaproteobacteria bacterium]